jgi:hypothetical protein
MTQQFRKKPVVIEAWHIQTQADARGTPGVCTGGRDCPKHGPEDCWPHVHTLEGDHTWSEGDWLIRGVKGEFYFCKPDIFAATYEPASVSGDSVSVPRREIETVRMLVNTGHLAGQIKNLGAGIKADVLPILDRWLSSSLPSAERK